jgi:transcriptional regulator with XRE-family HTH domain
LRCERERLRLSQADLARIGGVSRNSQLAYESGKTPFTSEYLKLVTDAGVDPAHVITGVRSEGSLGDDHARLLAGFDALSPHDRATILRIISSLSAQAAPPVVSRLPSRASLAEAFGALLDASPGLAGDDLAHELATRLPIILRAAEREIASPRSGATDVLGGQQADPADARRASQQGRNT